MEEVGRQKSWTEELASLVEDTGIRFTGGDGDHTVSSLSTPSFELKAALEEEEREGEGVESESFKDQMKGFAKAWGEIGVELGKGCKDVVLQTVLTDDSFIVKKVRGPSRTVAGKLRVLNDFLPEDRDPVHACLVILSVFLVALSVLSVNIKYENTPVPLQGVSADKARYSIVAPHSFLSSRLAGIPGIKSSLLEEFGVRLVTYDLPGFGKAMCTQIGLFTHQLWTFYTWQKLLKSKTNSGCWDIQVGYACAALVAPMVNPYDPGMTRRGEFGTWEKWTRRRKLMYYLARRFPRFLRFFYRRTFLSGKHGPIDKWLSFSLAEQDKALTEDPGFKEFWQRDVEESIRQGNTKPFIEEAALQVSNWPFSLTDLQVQRKCPEKGLFHWLNFMSSEEECEIVGFLEPIHIWQGMEDLVVPSSMTDYVARVLPSAIVHKLPDQGHFSYFYLCDECHRTILSTLFGEPQGPIEASLEEEDQNEDSVILPN
ncbi:hypothetical protein OSB04_009474 [Centaurea solstitialis]|uniref:AB hydrolase-1 domain-containing protein n=1 Tax=Centaurea solstitialis TaxID=347529 RepID=A0AA38THJ1_9ASTR|nr:hypothetical protein OSB04_009474 [Centaurea solstitialis]